MNVSHPEHIQGSSFPSITRQGPAKIPVSRRSAQETSHLGSPGQDPQSLFGLEHESKVRPKGMKESSPPPEQQHHSKASGHMALKPS